MKGLATVATIGVLTLATVAPALGQQPNPCAAKKPGQTVQNPCKSKNPVAMNPASAKERSTESDGPTAAKRSSVGDSLFGAGPTLRPLQSR